MSKDWLEIVIILTVFGSIGIVVVGLVVGFTGQSYAYFYTQETIEGTVIAVNPDTQITYNRVTFSVDSNGYTFTESISCTGDFQFKVGQSVSIISVDTWFVLWKQYYLNSLPSGCVQL